MKMRSVDAAAGSISARYIKENTEHSYEQYIDSLNLFFGDTQLTNIHWYNMKQYQEARVDGAEPFIRRRRPHEEPGPCPAKPAKVNQELRLLKRVMKRANAWTGEDEEFFEELQEDDNEVPRSLSPEEQRHWLDVSRLKERWMGVHWYSLLAFASTMSTNEQRGLRIADINLHQQVISVPWPAAKNRYRHRTIALESSDAIWALERLIGRANDLGAKDGSHYLFPFRDIRKNCYVPDRHMTVNGIRARWEEVREAAGLKWFRPYDTRHTAITRLAEAGLPLEVIKAKAGHISDKMSRHYTQISLSAQRKWMRFAENQYRTDNNGYAPPAYAQQGAARDMVFYGGGGSERSRGVSPDREPPRAGEKFISFKGKLVPVRD
jgi:integrase